jgi:hypothetical protein
MEFKGTKGNWKRVKLEKTQFHTETNEIQYGKDGECIAEFVQNDYDAQLISCAPEMLEMLLTITLTPTFEKAKDLYGYSENHWTNKLEQLIKKATEI